MTHFAINRQESKKLQLAAVPHAIESGGHVPLNGEDTAASPKASRAVDDSGLIHRPVYLQNGEGVEKVGAISLMDQEEGLCCRI